MCAHKHIRYVTHNCYQMKYIHNSFQEGIRPWVIFSKVCIDFKLNFGSSVPKAMFALQLVV